MPELGLGNLPRLPDFPKLPTLPGAGVRPRGRASTAREGLLQRGVRTHRTQGGLPAAEEAGGKPYLWPPDVAGWTGSEPEWAIFWAHRVLGLGVAPTSGLWDYQVALGGGHIAGGLQLDFEEYDVRVGIQVQGIFWHYERSTQVRSRDALSRAVIAHFDLTPVFIDEDDALRAPVRTLELARAGIDISRQARSA